MNKWNDLVRGGISDSEYYARMTELTEKETVDFQYWLDGNIRGAKAIAGVQMHYLPKGKSGDRNTVVYAEKEGIHSWFHAQPHLRYVLTPMHTHNYIELAYVVVGHCENMTENGSFMLQQGDLLFLSPAFKHTIGLMEQGNLMLNIMFLPHQAEKILSNGVQGNELLNSFFADAIYRNTENYLLIRRDQNDLPERVLRRMLRLYWEETETEQALEQLLSCFFTLLAQKMRVNPSCVEIDEVPDPVGAKLIQYIKDRCATCTLRELAREFGYNESWLSTKIRRYAGKNFVQLRNEFRMQLVEEKLQMTKLPVKTIAAECGYGDSTQFYKTYKAHFGRLPREDLKK